MNIQCVLLMYDRLSKYHKSVRLNLTNTGLFSLNVNISTAVGQSSE